jgi:hypothetical protein
VAMLLITFLAPIASANEDERLITDEITTSNVYSLLLKAENKDQEKILQYIDELKLSTEEKAELKGSLTEAWKRYPEMTTKEDHIIAEKVCVLLQEYIKDTKSARSQPKVMPLPAKIPTENYEQPFRYLLEANSNEQKILIEYINNSFITEKEKQEMKNSMKDIWSRYPDKITEDDHEILKEVETATGEYFNSVYGVNSNPKWNKPNHEEITYESIIKLSDWEEGISTTHAAIAGACADEPDNWDSDSGTWGLIWHSVTHFRNPVIHLGLAHSCFEDWGLEAQSNYTDASFVNSYENIGWASHYLVDLSNPLHTGESSSQIAQYLLGNNIHYMYENYVNANWDSGYEYSETLNNVNSYYQIEDNDLEDVADSLAAYTHDYSGTLFDIIYYYPEDFESNQTVIAITDDCLMEGMRYNIGFAKYIRGTKGDYDGDDDVDFDDFVEFAESYNTTVSNPEYEVIFDFDEDGDIDFDDFVMFSGVYQS